MKNLTTFTIQEVALISKMSKSTIRNRINDGKLTTWRDGRIIRIERERLESYLGRHLTDDEIMKILEERRPG